jgi:hypothetical protein
VPVPALQVEIVAQARHYSRVVPGTGTILTGPGRAWTVLFRAVPGLAHRVSAKWPSIAGSLGYAADRIYRHTKLYTALFIFICVDTFLEAPITQENQRRCSLVRRGRSAAQGRTVRDLARGGGALWSGVDGPRRRAGRSATWCRSSCSLPDGRTVRACAGAAEDRRRRLDLAPGRDPVGEERS